MNKDNKLLIGAVIAVGLVTVYNFYWTKLAIAHAFAVAGGATDVANNPQSLVDADFVSPVATHAAPRMYVNSGNGSNGHDNPGESWIQGGGSSVTNTTGRWAA